MRLPDRHRGEPARQQRVVPVRQQLPVHRSGRHLRVRRAGGHRAGVISRVQAKRPASLPAIF